MSWGQGIRDQPNISQVVIGLLKKSDTDPPREATEPKASREMSVRPSVKCVDDLTKT